MGKKKPVFGPKMQLFKFGSATCDTHSWPSPLSSLPKLCVIVLHTHGYHPRKVQFNLGHHNRVVIFAPFLLACCYLLLLNHTSHEGVMVRREEVKVTLRRAGNNDSEEEPNTGSSTKNRWGEKSKPLKGWFMGCVGCGEDHRWSACPAVGQVGQHTRCTRRRQPPGATSVPREDEVVTRAPRGEKTASRRGAQP